MTNLSNSPLKKPNKLIIIHGLNNNAQSFEPLMSEFKQLGWETHFVTLPCHGENRKEASDFKEAFACFDRSMRELADSPYAVIAFSQGALYFQLWLEKRPDKRPLAQVLLAPALYIHRHGMIGLLTKMLPAFISIKSFSPKAIRRYGTLSISEYRILMEGLAAYQRLNGVFKLPTMILIDPKDELVDADMMALRLSPVELFPREYLGKKMGIHHIIFHPDYFSADDWKRFIVKINDFLKMGFEERTN